MRTKEEKVLLSEDMVFAGVISALVKNQWIVNSGLCLFIFWGFIQAALGRRANAVGSLSQVHRTARLDWMRSLVEPYLKANLDVTYAETFEV